MITDPYNETKKTGAIRSIMTAMREDSAVGSIPPPNLSNEIIINFN